MRKNNGRPLRIIVLRNLDIASATVGARLENDAFAHGANLALHDVKGDSSTVVKGRDPFDGSCETLDRGGVCDRSIRGCLLQQHMQPLPKKGEALDGKNHVNTTRRYLTDLEVATLCVFHDV